MRWRPARKGVIQLVRTQIFLKNYIYIAKYAHQGAYQWVRNVSFSENFAYTKQLIQNRSGHSKHGEAFTAIFEWV